MEKCSQFLTHILPNEGWRCGVALSGKQRTQKLFQTNDELAAFLTAHDADGWNCYHGCAVFKTRINRKAENALGAKAFWLDLDVDAEDLKKYGSQAEAATDLGRFCKAISFPPPTVVNSGYGLHVYWVLDHMLDPAQWRASAQALKQHCAKHNLKADPSRTADISSILRTPGTHNHKHD